MPRKAKPMPLFDKPPLPKQLYECTQCDDELYAAEWEARCIGWIDLENVSQDHHFAVCNLCAEKVTSHASR